MVCIMLNHTQHLQECNSIKRVSQFVQVTWHVASGVFGGPGLSTVNYDLAAALCTCEPWSS